MSGTTATVWLWLFVINLGVAFGAGVYELRIVVPMWLTSDQSGVHWRGDIARRDDVGRRFWGFVTTGPLTLITFANLYAAWYSTGAVRGPWLAAGVIELAGRLFTFVYFIPTMVRLMNAADSPAAVATAGRWRTLSYLRLAIVFAAWIAALRAFALLYQQST